MKKLSLITLVTAIMFMALLPITLSAETALKVYQTEVRKQPTPTIGNQNEEEDNEGQRVPSRPMACTISISSGITIYGCSDEIESYELWDAEGNNCLAVETNEMEFVNAIFSYDKDCQIRMKIADSPYSYIGYVLK